MPWGDLDARRDFWREWLHAHHFPSFACPLAERLGASGDGGKWVCDPDRIAELAAVDPGGEGRDRSALQPSACLVYSFGSNGEASFERAVHKRLPECEIHTF